VVATLADDLMPRHGTGCSKMRMQNIALQNLQLFRSKATWTSNLAGRFTGADPNKNRERGCV